MIRCIRRPGNSIVLSLPKVVMDDLGIEDGGGVNPRWVEEHDLTDIIGDKYE